MIVMILIFIKSLIILLQPNTIKICKFIPNLYIKLYFITISQHIYYMIKPFITTLNFDEKYILYYFILIFVSIIFIYIKIPLFIQNILYKYRVFF